LRYGFNISNWIFRNLPFKRRTEASHKWIESLLAPLQELVDDFKAVSDDLDNKVKFSGQQKSLAFLLNNLFDNTDRRIRVETVSDIKPPVVMWHDSELDEGAILWHDSESSAAPIIWHDSEQTPYNYRVIVPASLSGDAVQITAWVNRYNIATKTFIIIYE
jgi:hypothetical protein